MENTHTNTPKQVSGNQVNQLFASLTRFTAHFLIFLSCVIATYYFTQVSFLVEIDYFDFLSDVLLALVLLITTYYTQGLNGPARLKNFLLVGLFFFYLAFFMDTLSELFVQTIMTTTIFENSFQLLGLCLISYGVRGWWIYSLDVHKHLKRTSSQDQLTGALNRRSFLSYAENEFVRACRYRRNLAIAFIDIDHFKKINDTLGHSAGDLVIKELAKNIMSLLRENDYFCRWGGEEYIVLLPECSICQCLKIVERIRKFTEMTPITEHGERESRHPIYITLSAGCTVIHQDDHSIEDMIERADEALYRAKKEGRNKVCTNWLTEDT